MQGARKCGKFSSHPGEQPKKVKAPPWATHTSSDCMRCLQDFFFFACSLNKFAFARFISAKNDSRKKVIHSRFVRVILGRFEIYWALPARVQISSLSIFSHLVFITCSWSSGYDRRLPSDGPGFNSRRAQLFLTWEANWRRGLARWAHNLKAPRSKLGFANFLWHSG